MFYDVKTSYDKGLVVKNNSSLINKLFVVCISEKLEDLYAFNYKPHAQDTLTRQAGWALFDISSEYSRMNIPNNEWVHTTINVDYKVSVVKMIFICCRCLDQPSIWECCTPTSPLPPPPNLTINVECSFSDLWDVSGASPSNLTINVECSFSDLWDVSGASPSNLTINVECSFSDLWDVSGASLCAKKCKQRSLGGQLQIQESATTASSLLFPQGNQGELSFLE